MGCKQCYSYIVRYKFASKILHKPCGSPYTMFQAWLKQLCDCKKVKAAVNKYLRNQVNELSDATETFQALDLLPEVNSLSW